MTSFSFATVVNEAVEVLTGIPAGERDFEFEDYPKDSLYALADVRLQKLRDHVKRTQKAKC